MTFQDAGWDNGPWLDSGGRQKNNSIYVTWREYFEEISNGSTTDDYRMPQEDILPELMWGSQVLQRIAQQVRKSENLIVQAEKLGLLANLSNGYRYRQSDMDEAWRTLMLAQHHDSWIVPYNRLNKERTWAGEIEVWTNNTNEIGEMIIAEAGHSFGQTGAPGYVRVFNTQGAARNEPVRVTLPAGFEGRQVTLYDINENIIEAETDDNTLVFMAEVPPFGFSTYRLAFGQTQKSEFSEVRYSGQEECVVENGMYRIVFDPARGGTIVSLVAKQQGGREFADKTSEYSLGEIRGHFYDDGRFYSSADAPAEVAVVKCNGLETVVVVKGTIASHPFTQTVTLLQGEPRIDFDLTIDWQGNPGIGEYRQVEGWAPNRRAFSDGRFKLNILFPTNLDSPTLYKDAPFDVCESRLDNTFFQTWDAIKHNVILNWVDLAEKGDGYGLALLSDHTTSYAYGEDFPLGLTAQYSGVGLWNRNYDIEGPLHMSYAIIPHHGKWDTAAINSQASNWKEPLRATLYDDIAPEVKSFIDIQGTGYELSAAYPTDNGVVVRIYNSEGDSSPQKVAFGFPVSQVSEIDLNGNVVGRKQVSAKNDMTISMPRFGLRTYLISNPS